MGDYAWWPITAVVTLVNPVVIVAGIATGLVVKRWWQVSFGLTAAPAAYWMYYTIFLGTAQFGSLLSLLALTGVIWTATVFGFKKATRQ